MRDFLRKYVRREITASELQKENEALLRQNQELREKIWELNAPDRVSGAPQPLNEATTRAEIDKIVDRILASPGNIKFLPDMIERQIYQNVLSALLEVLNDTVDRTRFRFLGHEISLKFENISE